MGSVGRYFCVALPFILTIASLIATLIVGLTGATSNELYLFRVDVSNFTINGTQLQDIAHNSSSLLSDASIDSITNKIQNLANDAGQKISDELHNLGVRSPLDWHDPSFLESVKETTGNTDDNKNSKAALNLDSIIDNIGGNVKITAADLGMANIYDFTLWGYCTTPQHGEKTCTKPQFDWASQNISSAWVEKINGATGFNVTVPSELDDGLKTYRTITKWTEVVFIISVIALGLELLTGLFTACSRAVSCVTWIFSGIATAAVAALAVLLTLTASTVVGLVLSIGEKYQIKANLNMTYLAVLWLGVAFALGAGLFWLLSVCCCKPEARSHKSRSLADTEKIGAAGSYAPLGENTSSYNAYNYGAPQRGGARSDLAYEPYHHS